MPMPLTPFAKGGIKKLTIKSILKKEEFREILKISTLAILDSI